MTTNQSATGGHEYWSDPEGASGSEQLALSCYPWTKQYGSGSRWYKGDFHVHTTLSDGKMTPSERTEHAERLGLDFFVATDHNLIPTSWPKSSVLVIPGVEVTSFRGHFNAIGLRKWMDWTSGAADGGLETEEGMNRLLKETAELGGLRSINHAMLIPWAWLVSTTKLTEIDCLEIWNDPTFTTNPVATEKALQLWNAILNEGYRIPGIGGSDVHLRPEDSYQPGGPPSVIGDPATYVWADGLSVESILQGVRSGAVYVSRGPDLQFTATVGERRYLPGSDITEAVRESPDGTVHFTAEISNGSDAFVHWIENGKEVFSRSINGKTTVELTLQWNPEEYRWMRLEIRKNDRELLAFSNPIYCGHKKPSIVKWGEMIIQAYPYF